jgi:hypothetical protein
MRQAPKAASESVDLESFCQHAMLEIRQCLPFFVGLVGNTCDVIPLRIAPAVGVYFPWMRHYTNPHIPSDNDRKKMVSASLAANALLLVTRRRVCFVYVKTTALRLGAIRWCVRRVLCSPAASTVGGRRWDSLSPLLVVCEQSSNGVR